MPEFIDVRWRKSSFSGGNGNCVEVAALPGGEIAVRNSNDPGAGAMLCTRAAMAGWIEACRAGEFDGLL